MPVLEELAKKFSIRPTDIAPRVYVRLADNWAKRTGLLLCKDHDIRGLRDHMSREMADTLDRSKIGVSSTDHIVGQPRIGVRMEPRLASTR